MTTSYSRTQLSDETLSHQLSASFARERASTAELLADIAEFDARRLYLPAGYPSMFAYCTDKFGLSEQAAFKRIRVARVARRHPSLFAAIESGRLNLTLIVLVAPYLKHGDPEGLLASAEGKSRFEVEKLLAERFPRADIPARLRLVRQQPAPDSMWMQGTLTAMGPIPYPITGRMSDPSMVPGINADMNPGANAHANQPLGSRSSERGANQVAIPATSQLSSGTVVAAGAPAESTVGSMAGSAADTPNLVGGPAGDSMVGSTATASLVAGAAAPLAGPMPDLMAAHPTSQRRVTPLSPKRYALQVTIGQIAHDKLRQAQALLSHQIPTGDLAQVLEKVLDLAIAQLERQKLAAVRSHKLTTRPHKPATRPHKPTTRPHKTQARSTNPRTIPAHVKRAVTARDGGQCTFVSSDGHRCTERRFLEFDHVVEVARGGRATVDGIRLRCRAHNQYTAEQTFGATFMSRKRAANYSRSTTAT
ncbi:MAG TPA: hypothetical protein VFQ05_15530 [Candidatus Eisenbacteria bacterium]|nr:hypothetical protein [Candidatus Eisenbacteria bacterium]